LTDFCLTINLVSGDVDEPTNFTVLFCTLKQDLSAKDIGQCELIGMSKGQIHMRLSGEMQDSVDIVFSQAVHYITRVCNIAFVEAEIWLFIQVRYIVQTRAVIEFVKADDVIAMAVCQCEMAYHPGSASSRTQDQQGHDMDAPWEDCIFRLT